MTYAVLIAGVSGTGKTMLSYRLARQLEAAIIEVDDLVIATQAMTTPSTHPIVHQYLSNDTAGATADEIANLQIRFAQTMQPAIAAVVDNHVQTRTRVIIEGDYVIPGAITGRGVATVLIDEDDLEQLTENYLTREPHRGAQRERATASVAYGRWLKEQALESGVAVVAARPWDSVLIRLTSALDAQ